MKPKNLIKEMFDNKGITQEQIENKFPEITPKTAQCWRRGVRLPSNKFHKRLSVLLKVPYKDFMRMIVLSTENRKKKDNCGNCGNEFVVYHYSQKYCSKYCAGVTKYRMKQLVKEKKAKAQELEKYIPQREIPKPVIKQLHRSEPIMIWARKHGLVESVQRFFDKGLTIKRIEFTKTKDPFNPCYDLAEEFESLPDINFF